MNNFKNKNKFRNREGNSNKICTICGVSLIKDINWNSKNKTYRCKKCVCVHGSDSQHKYRVSRRNEIKRLLGNKCNNPKCPIPLEKMDVRCLQIDHVNGDGKGVILTTSKLKGVIEEIKSGSKRYQLLCAYCNWLKSFENKERRLR